MLLEIEAYSSTLFRAKDQLDSSVLWLTYSIISCLVYTIDEVRVSIPSFVSKHRSPKCILPYNIYFLFAPKYAYILSKHT